MTATGAAGPAEPSTDRRPVRALDAEGTVVRLRELDDRDAPLVAALHRDLPPYDRYLRFFSAGAVPTQDVVLRGNCPGDISLGAFRDATLSVWPAAW